MIGPAPATWAVDAGAARARPALPGVWRLRLPSAYWHIDHSNAYLVEGADGPMLVDCGSGGHPTAGAALSRALAETGHAVEDVRDLVLTHHHSDHVGAAAWVKERSGCRVWLHPAHAHFTDAAREPDRVRAARHALAVRAGTPAWLLDACASVQEEQEGLDGPVDADRTLREGLEIESGVGTWRVLETPGHSPSHVSLHLAEQRVLISGDLIFAVFSPHFDLGHSADPVQEYLTSLERIGALDVAVALPGHGRPMSADEVATAVASHTRGVHEHLEAAVAATRDGATAFAVMTALFPAEAQTQSGAWRVLDTVAYLEHLERTGRVARERSPDGVDRYLAR